MDKKIYIFASIVLIFGLLGLLANNIFEIHEGRRFSPPSRETLTNEYLAMQKWLSHNGSNLRISFAPQGSYNPARIMTLPENIAIINASACKWENAGDYFITWIENGGLLIICIDYNEETEIDENLLEFLSDLGIETEITTLTEGYWTENIPNFDWNISFLFSNEANNESNVMTINDNLGFTRLIEISMGEGTLTVTGSPRFMTNYYIRNEINARLSWSLTGARISDNKNGVYFVRTGNVSKSFFERISEIGNIVPLLLSALILIIIGFWMVIPVFGLVFDEKKRHSRPITERFAAEIGFLKKHKALNYYLEVYEREMKKGDGQLSELKEYNYKEIIDRLRVSHSHI